MPPTEISAEEPSPLTRMVWLIQRALSHPDTRVGDAMLVFGAPVLAALLDRPTPAPRVTADDVFEDAFEAWLIERWLAHIRSPEYRDSPDYHYLRAEWERGR